MSRLESASLVAEDPTLKIDLQQAFERFAQASTRLEDRYQGLLQESQLLRARIAEQEAEIA
ncbi:MAG: hypothetical protein DCC75_03185, partial [Proteobacteria bacterium]